MFKNAKAYHLQAPFSLEQLAFSQALQRQAFRPCGPTETETKGWSSPLGIDPDLLVHTVGRVHLVAMRRQERLLPSAVLNEALDERVADIEQREHREVGRKERRELREDLLTDMLPRAFTRSRMIRAYIDAEAGWIVVDASSDKLAEEVLSLLRESLGSFPVTPLAPEIDAADRLSAWMRRNQAAEGFTLEDSCVLKDIEDSRATVRCKGRELNEPEILNHLGAGMRAVSLGLNWKDRLTLTLSEDLSLKQLRFADEVTDDLDTGETEDDGALLDAELSLLSLELRGLLNQLCEEFEIALPQAA